MPLEAHKFYFITNIKICLKGERKSNFARPRERRRVTQANKEMKNLNHYVMKTLENVKLYSEKEFFPVLYAFCLVY